VLLSTIDVIPRSPFDASPDPAESHDGIAMLEHSTIAEVVLDRPEVLNALDFAMWRRVAEVFDGIAHQTRTRVVVIRGAGDRAFSSGADIAEFRDRRTGTVNASRYNRTVGDALTAIRDAPQPVVAMIRGLAVGGGCEIAAACDLRIASENSRFGLPIGRLGVTLGPAEARAVTALIGASRVQRLIFTGQLLDATEALRIGLVDQVVPPAALDEETWSLARTIAAIAPTAARANKLVVNMFTFGSSPAQDETLRELTARVYEGNDLKEGIAAFLEKRPPRFERDDDA
jgi:enoyl-CoA hydratase